jgi:hypothetical protein
MASIILLWELITAFVTSDFNDSISIFRQNKVVCEYLLNSFLEVQQVFTIRHKLSAFRALEFFLLQHFLIAGLVNWMAAPQVEPNCFIQTLFADCACNKLLADVFVKLGNVYALAAFVAVLCELFQTNAAKIAAVTVVTRLRVLRCENNVVAFVANLVS